MDRPIDPNHVRRKKLGLSLRIAIAVVVLAAAAFATRRLLQPALDLDELRTAQVERGTIEAGVSCGGVVVPGFEQVLSSPIDGIVHQILLKPGASVRQGQAILALDLGTLIQEAAQLEERIALLTKQGESKSLERRRQVLDNRGRQAIQKLEVDALEARMQRHERLKELGLISTEEYAEARLNLEKAKVELSQIQLGQANLEEVEQAESASHRSELALLQQDLTRNRALQRDATVRADRDGMLTWVVADEGLSVQRGAVLARVADLSAYRVEASVSGLLLERLAPAQRARIKIGRQQLEGKVEQINPAIQQGVAKVSIALDQKDHSALKPNLSVQVFVVTDHKPDTLLLANGPFIDGPGEQQVFVIEGQYAKRRTITPGLANADQVEIVSGLRLGDQVILSKMEAYRQLEQVPLQR